jgi:hypothetical protein
MLTSNQETSNTLHSEHQRGSTRVETIRPKLRNPHGLTLEQAREADRQLYQEKCRRWNARFAMTRNLAGYSGGLHLAVWAVLLLSLTDPVYHWRSSAPPAARQLQLGTIGVICFLAAAISFTLMFNWLQRRVYQSASDDGVERHHLKPFL